MFTRTHRLFAASAAVLAVAVTLGVSGTFTAAPAPAEPISAEPPAPVATAALPTATPAALPSQEAECRYDPEKSPVSNFDELVTFTDAMLGNTKADVTVVEYFDPNCSHCRALHPVMMELVEKYEDEALFVFKPFPLRPREAPWLMQTEALHAAQQEGKFFPMMEAQMSRQHLITPSGLPLDALRAAAVDAGMDPDAMMRKIQSGVYRTHVKNEYEKAHAAGLTGTPMVIINGNVVPASSRNVACLGRLIEEAAG